MALQEFDRRLAAARAGSGEELGSLLNTMRGYLLVLANGAVNQRLRAKVSASDVVQQTMLLAHERFDQFRGDSSGELIGWLREILANNVRLEERRYLVAEKRQVGRERSLDLESRRHTVPEPTDPCPTPRAEFASREEARHLERAIARLSAEHRTVVLLRSWERLPFAEVGKRMNRTAEAARKLWGRAVLELQRELRSAGAIDTTAFATT